jgi:hypothetical protein
MTDDKLKEFRRREARSSVSIRVRPWLFLFAFIRSRRAVGLVEAEPFAVPMCHLSSVICHPRSGRHLSFVIRAAATGLFARIREANPGISNNRGSTKLVWRSQPAISSNE